MRMIVIIFKKKRNKENKQGSLSGFLEKFLFGANGPFGPKNGA